MLNTLFCVNIGHNEKRNQQRNTMSVAVAVDMTNMSREELMEALETERTKTEKKIVVKVSPKGCVQVNGIRKFPITFYKNEWETLFSLRDRIEDFIVENDDALAIKA